MMSCGRCVGCGFFKKFLCRFLYFTPILIMLYGCATPSFVIDPNLKENAQDFNLFIEKCSLEEKVLMLQSLRGLKYELEDEYFGKLKGLPQLDRFTIDPGQSSATLPLKPKTFNDVMPITVLDAVDKGILDRDLISRKNIGNELIWRRYNKLNYYFHNNDEIDYHKDIVQWVASKNEIDPLLIESLSTYELERRISYKFFSCVWDELSQSQKIRLLDKVEHKSSSFIPNKKNIASLPGVKAIEILGNCSAFSGFALYQSLFTVFFTASEWMGAQYPWGAGICNPTTITTISCLNAWNIAGGIGQLVYIGWSEEKIVANFVMTVNAIKSNHL